MTELFDIVNVSCCKGVGAPTGCYLADEKDVVAKVQKRRERLGDARRP